MIIPKVPSDIDDLIFLSCIPLMEKHNKIFGRYPEKAVADAGYGNPVCPNNKKFIKLYDKPIKKNIDHRTEEVYVCESCEGCPFKDRCFKAKNEEI